MSTSFRPVEVVLLCNPRAGGRWRVLADVLDSDEAKNVHRIVTDEIDDVREAIAGLGQRVKLLCIYGGDGTIFRIINELLRNATATPPRLALLGGGTMNVTARWLGMSGSPGDNFRRLMRAYAADQLLWREVPLLSVENGDQRLLGFTFGMGPLVRILQAFEAGTKSHLHAIAMALKSIAGAVSGMPRDFQEVLRKLEGEVTVDGRQLPYYGFSAVFANVTGVINPFVVPFVGDRTRETFHYLAYAVSARELAIMTPMLARGLLPIDPLSLLKPVSTWRQVLLSVVGKGELPVDPRYVNGAASELIVEAPETHYTIDGEVLPARSDRFAVRLGPQLHLASL